MATPGLKGIELRRGTRKLRLLAEELIVVLLDLDTGDEDDYSIPVVISEDILKAANELLETTGEDSGATVFSEWLGCGECDVIFGCYDGYASCIRLPSDRIDGKEPSEDSG